MKNNEEILEYDRSQDWSEYFDVLTPQQCANMFGKPVKDGDKIYYPKEDI